MKISHVLTCTLLLKFALFEGFLLGITILNYAGGNCRPGKGWHLTFQLPPQYVKLMHSCVCSCVTLSIPLQWSWMEQEFGFPWSWIYIYNVVLLKKWKINLCKREKAVDRPCAVPQNFKQWGKPGSCPKTAPPFLRVWVNPGDQSGQRHRFQQKSTQKSASS